MGKDLKGKDLGQGIYQRPDGRYCGRAMVRGKKITLYDLNLKKLKSKLAEAKLDALKSVVAEASVKNGAMTLNTWFEEWYSKYKAPTLKNGGSQQYRRKYLNYFGNRIGTKPINEILQLHIQTCIADLIDNNYSSKSISEAVGILRSCMEAAMANRLIMANPVVGVVLPKSHKVERRVLAADEQKIFLDYVRNNRNWFEETYNLMLLTGMRIGEIGALRWDDIDFSNRFICVKRSLTYCYEGGKKTVSIGTLKTDNSVRKIPFFGETKYWLERQFRKVSDKKKELGEDRWYDEKQYGNLVFVTSRGTPVSRYSIQTDLKSIVRQINEMYATESRLGNMEFRQMVALHPHAFRHTFATRCFEKGMSPRAVQAIMGHSNYSTTCSYTHVLDDVKHAEADRLGNFLDNGGNTLPEDYSMERLLGIL